MKKFQEVPSVLAGDLRVALGALVLAVSLAFMVPGPASASICPGEEAEGCGDCGSFRGAGGTLFVGCGCCEDGQGGATCVYCRAE